MLGIGRLLFGTTRSVGNDRARSRLVSSVIVLATGSALLAATAARADDPQSVTRTVLATGGVYGGMTQINSVCYAFNSGTSPVTVGSLVIRNQFGAVIGTTSCPSLAPGTLCAIQVGVTNTMAYSCTMTSTSPNAADLRGVIDFRDVNQNLLINSNLH
jgi:hypothetical protein